MSSSTRAPPPKPGETVRAERSHFTLREPPRAPLRAESRRTSRSRLSSRTRTSSWSTNPPGWSRIPRLATPDGTLVNALLAPQRERSQAARARSGPGIVHRLDKDTSGLIVIAQATTPRTLSLAAQFAERTTEKRYLALARGWPRAESGSIDAPIARHRSDRKKDGGGCRAVTVERSADDLPPACSGSSRAKSAWPRRCSSAACTAGAPTKSACTSSTSATRFVGDTSLWRSGFGRDSAARTSDAARVDPCLRAPAHG